MEAIVNAGYKPGEDICLAMDVAATELFKDGRYELAGEGKSLTTDEMIALRKPGYQVSHHFHRRSLE